MDLCLWPISANVISRFVFLHCQTMSRRLDCPFLRLAHCPWWQWFHSLEENAEMIKLERFNRLFYPCLSVYSGFSQSRLNDHWDTIPRRAIRRPARTGITIYCMEITMSDQCEHWWSGEIHIANFVRIEALSARRVRDRCCCEARKITQVLLRERRDGWCQDLGSGRKRYLLLRVWIRCCRCLCPESYSSRSARATVEIDLVTWSHGWVASGRSYHDCQKYSSRLWHSFRHLSYRQFSQWFGREHRAERNASSLIEIVCRIFERRNLACVDRQGHCNEGFSLLCLGLNQRRSMHCSTHFLNYLLGWYCSTMKGSRVTTRERSNMTEFLFGCRSFT